MNMDLLDRLLEHDRWGTTVIFEKCRALTDAQLDQPFDIGLGTLRGTLDHLVLNMEFWTGVMIGQPIPYQRAPSSVETQIADYGRAQTAFAALARRLRDEGRLEETFVDHFEQPMTNIGAILHVLLHDDEHRSEAVHILTRLGQGEIEVDHGLWDHVNRGAAI